MYKFFNILLDSIIKLKKILLKFMIDIGQRFSFLSFFFCNVLYNFVRMMLA